MTDKQIIDGIDVSGCTRYCADNGKCTAFKSQYLCSERNNCYTKRILKKNKTINILKEKLLRKEQECEELKEQLKEMNEVIRTETTRCNLVNILKTELDQLKAELTRANCQIADDEILQCDMREAIEELKAENESWQKEYWKLEQGNDFLAEKNSKLKGCLTEIKEIAEHCINQDICTTCDNSDKCHIEDEEIPTYDVCKLILQKISECEGNDENN